MVKVAKPISISPPANMVLASLGNISKYANVQPRWNNLAPRFGLAYTINTKTVLRAGYGRSYAVNTWRSELWHLLLPMAHRQQSGNQFFLQLRTDLSSRPGTAAGAKCRHSE
jgi:hypothetical protein